MPKFIADLARHEEAIYRGEIPSSKGKVGSTIAKYFAPAVDASFAAAALVAAADASSIGASKLRN